MRSGRWEEERKRPAEDPRNKNAPALAEAHQTLEILLRTWDLGL